MASERKLAIMRHVKFGVIDRGYVALTFDAYTSESSAALQVLPVEDAIEFIKAYGVSDVHALEGQPCWVNAGDGTITWSGPWTG